MTLGKRMRTGRTYERLLLHFDYSCVDNSIRVSGITKRFGSVTALDGVTLDIKPGIVYGVLGPNGSGKTTLLRLINSILTPDEGEILVSGLNTRKNSFEIKEKIGYVPETPALYESLTPREYFSFIIAARKSDVRTSESRIRALVDAFGIRNLMHQYIGSLSFGNKQKVAIISSLLHDPDIVVMDEGMNGLDPRSSKILKTLLTDFASMGKIVLLSTHVLEVAQNLCQSVFILYKGKIVAQGTMDQLKDETGETGNLEEIFLKKTDSYNIDDVLSTLKETFSDE